MTTMPVDKGFEVTSPYGPRWGTTHWGTDFGLAGGCGGKPIYAVKSGTVVRVGPASGFGQWIGVDHPASNGGGETIYGHVIPEVKLGQAVSEGQRIGRINPDSATNGGVSPHLHLEWHRYSWTPPGPNRLDPMKMLAGAGYPGQAPIKAPASVKAAGGIVLDWTSRFRFGGPRAIQTPTGICVHVTVNAPGTPAENVANWQINTESGSYHELVDTRGLTLIANTDDWQVWAAGPTSNARHLHISLVMKGTESRVDWLMQETLLRTAAARAAIWVKRYNFPVVKLSGADLRAGKKGLFGHIDTAHAWGETDHVDPGAGFPWDIFLGYINEELTGAKTTRKEAGTMLSITYFTDFIKGFFGPVISDIKDLRQQITGGRDAGQYPGWSISALVKTATARPGDNATLPEMLAILITEQARLREEIATLKEANRVG